MPSRRLLTATLLAFDVLGAAAYLTLTSPVAHAASAAMRPCSNQLCVTESLGFCQYVAGFSCDLTYVGSGLYECTNHFC
jgi:hypothetical protein